MIRKTALAIAAIAALGTATLTATPAAAKGGKGGGGFHHGHHSHFIRGGIGLGLVAYDSCYRNVWVINRFGETVLRRLYVCG